MKKPNFYAGVFVCLGLLMIYIPVTGLFYQPVLRYTRFDTTKTVLLLMCPVLLLFIIAGVLGGRADKKNREWIINYGLKDVTEVKLVSVNGRKPNGDDLTHPSGIYKFVVWHGMSNATIKCYPSDPGFHELLGKISGSKAQRDTHITKTQIIAVNNNTFTDTKQRISITKALIGGLLAGEAGFILGGASGGSRSVSRPGENIYTFLVFYNDSPPQTEHVKESDQRFTYLVSKLNADE